MSGGRAVLVPAAQSLGSIGAIRSLGRAGYRVLAVSSDPRALGLRSKFAAAAAAVHPAGGAAFEQWLDAYIAAHGIELVMPAGGVSAYGWGLPARHAHLFPTSADPRLLELGESKFWLFGALAAAGGEASANLPPYLRADLSAPPELADLRRLGAPLFIKLDAIHAKHGGGALVIRASDAGDAQRRLAGLADDYHYALVQGFVPGQGAGAFLLRWDGRTVARMMHLRLHEMPHTGGASSLRRSWWHDAMMADAEAKLAAIGWQGVGMVEYRWDPATDRFALMEMNLRFWGSIHLALYAGVDFPALLADAFFGDVPAETVEGRLGVVARHLVPFELGYLTSLWRDPAVPTARKLGALAEAVALTLDPRVNSDLLFPGDRGLFFTNLFRSLRA